MTYRINNWDFFFETAETKKLKKMSWVPVPNKHDGLGYRTLVSAQNGFQTYAAWIVLLQVASKCPIRGLLTDSTGRSLSAADLELKTGIPKHVFEKAMTPLCEVGWLEEVIGAEEIVVSKSAGTPGEHPGTPADDPGTPGLKGREGKEGNGISSDEFVSVWNSLESPFSKIVNWSEKRKAALTTRMADDYFKKHWREALGKMKKSEFLSGGGSTGWIANVEWFLKPDSVTKIMENSYPERVVRDPSSPDFDITKVKIVS